MNKLRCLVSIVGLVGCGFPRPPDVPDPGSAGDAGGDSAPFVPPPSCVGQTMTCGPSGNESCCTSLAVPGGRYYRSFDLAGTPMTSGNTNAPATISRFRLDKYEVTVERFRAFVMHGTSTKASPPAIGSGLHPGIPATGWESSWDDSLAADMPTLTAALKCNPAFQTWTAAPGPNEHRPINCVTWYEAMAFCAWDGGFLPTEAEWNYAAAGGDAQRVYPWASPASSLQIDGPQASWAMGDGQECLGDGMLECALTDLVEVGTKPAGNGRWGQADLAGNVQEWVLDWYTSDYSNPCTDCAYLANTGYRVMRGGDLFSSQDDVRTGTRARNLPASRSETTGFRCARDAP